jgi:hypothetical protein
MLSAFRIIGELDLPLDSMWFRKSNFFTLCAEVSLNISRLQPDLRDRLFALEAAVMNAKGESSSKFGEYYSYMYQNTNGRKARIVRSKLFREFCVIP